MNFVDKRVEQEKIKLEQKKQNKYKKMLIEWQIDNEVIVNPFLDISPHGVTPNIVFIEANNDQVNALKAALNQFDQQTDIIKP